MFNKLLVANRGEIACRIIKTCKALGIRTVAVYSTVDRENLHVIQADEAFLIGEAAPKDSYLNIPALIHAAIQSGAQAIHPGYGFLSEHPLLAKACQEAGIVFIGPSISAMQAMASKQTAKQLLEKTKVPLTPGYHGKDQTDERLLLEAKRIGYPLLLKAANGGGGKGMRRVYHANDFLPALSSARREAAVSFGDDTMLIEKLLLNARHVEVQIIADNYGHVLHFFERDCSLQRRHQKIIEEAPAPNLSEELGQQLRYAACEVARSINYSGVGTVEFLVENDQFYFMEMNTRLQVEHPVTEMITNVDLVAWQIKIAANQVLSFSQEEILANGHAIECRIYAEDPFQDFMPSSGQLNFLKEPQGEHIRIDSGVQVSSIITLYYDPLLAKLITWGENREQALQRMQQALGNYAIGGLKTNLPFLKAICKHPCFVEAQHNTNFLAQEEILLPKPNQELALLMATSYDYLNLTTVNTDPLFKDSFAWQMHLPSQWMWQYYLEDNLIEAKITPKDRSSFSLEVEEKITHLSPRLVDNRLFLYQDGQMLSAYLHADKDSLVIFLDEGVISVKHFSWQNAYHPSSKKNQLTAPMPATVVAILKNIGDKIKEGDGLIVLEAMKMEHTIYAPHKGVLAELFYSVGSQVHEGAELLALKTD